MPLVMDIIGEYMQLRPEEVTKAGDGSAITYGRTKGAVQRRRYDEETI